MAETGHLPRSERLWKRQMAWNDKMRKILKDNGNQPIPETPDYSLKALEAWAVKQSVTVKNEKVCPNMWWREMHSLLQKEPKSMKGFTFMPKGEVQ